MHNVLFQDIHAVRGNIDGKLAIKRKMESDDKGKVCLFVYYVFISEENCVYLSNMCLFLSAEERGLDEELINSSWCGLLAALSLLLDAR